MTRLDGGSRRILRLSRLRRLDPSSDNRAVQVEFRAARTLGLLGPLASEDADRLLDAMAAVGPGGPITLDLTGVTSIDEGGVDAVRGAMRKTRDIGELLILLLPQTDALDQVRQTGLDEEPLILVEVLET